MSDIVTQRDIGSYVKPVLGLATVTLTAGATATDAAIQTGTGYNRLLPRHESAVLVTNVVYSLAAAKTVTVSRTIKDSPDDSTYTTYGSVVAVEVVGSTSSTAAQTGTYIISDKVDLTYANKYIRSTVTGDLSATTTDTAVVTQLWLMGGNDRNT